jgi:F5/8 type C domain
MKNPPITAVLVLTSALAFSACNTSPNIAPTTLETTTLETNTLEAGIEGRNGNLSSKAAPANVLPRTGWTVTASPTGIGNPNIIFDGNETVAWTSSAVQSNTMAIQIDLAAARSFNKIVMDAGVGSQNYARSYQIYLSPDTSGWGPMIANNQTATGPRLEIDLGARSGRYLTIQLGYAAPNKPWSISELWLTGPAPVATGTRDPWLRPFSANSIWNTPIGTGAQYVLPGHFKGGTAHNADTEIYFKLKTTDPLRPVYGTPNWTNRCGDRGFRQKEPDGVTPLSVNFPNDFTINGVDGANTPNNVATFLKPDGISLIAIEPLARCTVGGDIFGWVKNDTGNETLTGTGYFGGHWGSGLSGFGGSIRHGELTGTAPINHVLKLNVPGDYLYFDGNNPETAVNGVVLDGKGYRWPADRNDSGAPGNYKTGILNKAAKMGALVAIPAGVNLSSLGLTNPAAIKLAKTLQDYGAYIVDDAGAVVSRAAGGEYDYAQFSLSVQKEAEGEFREAFGYEFGQDFNASGPARTWFEDYGKLIRALAIINNNAPTSIGGPGARRVTNALPAFGATDLQAPTVPSNLRVTSRESTSVTLAWNASSDNVRIMRYDVLNAGKVVASSYGAASLKLENLKPNTVLNLSVKAFDTGFNASGTSAAIATSSKDGYNESFEAGAPGWPLGANVSVTNGVLKFTGWSGPATSSYINRSFAGPYMLRYSLNTDSQDDNGKSRTLFHSTNTANTYILEIGGGAANTIKLLKRVAGIETTISTYAGSYNINSSRPVIELSVGAGKITVKASGTNGNVTLFNNVADASFSGGKIGFEMIGTQSFVDDIALTIN